MALHVTSTIFLWTGYILLIGNILIETDNLLINITLNDFLKD